MTDSEHNKDNTFIILGNGPSLKDVNMEWIKENSDKFTVIGINRSYLAYPDHDMMFVQDVEPILELFDAGKTDEEIKAMSIVTTDYFDKRIRVMSRRRSYSKKEMGRLRELRKKGIIKTGGPRLYKTLGVWSVDQAIARVCYQFKAETANKPKPVYMYLLGFDLKHIPDQNHFYDKEVKKKCRWPNEGSNPRQIRRQLRYWQRVRKVFTRHNIKVSVIGENSELFKFYSSYKKIEQIFNSDPNPIGEKTNDKISLTRANSPKRVAPKVSLNHKKSYTKKILNIRARRRLREKNNEE